MNFNFPEYCEFHKFLLVDELATCDNPALIHYGKCSVIGYLNSSDSLGSLRIPNVQECYQLPDCFLNVRLVMEHHPIENLNTTVEVFGEVRLYDESKNSKQLESAHGLISKLRNLQTRLEDEMELSPRPPSGTNDKTMNSFVKCKLQREIESFKKTYKPVIQVYTLRHIQEAHEIIVENLHYRLIQKRRKTRLNLK